MIRLLLTQPFYGALATAISLRESAGVKQMEMTLFPVPTLSYNRAWYESLEEPRALGALLHELLHLLLLHALRRGERDPLLWAVCCDMAVNSFLSPEMLPRDAVTTERVAEKIKLALEPGGSAEQYYRQLYSLLDDSFSLLRRENTARLPFSDGNVLEAAIQKDEEPAHVYKQALEIRLRELIHRAHRNGEIAPQLLRELETAYTRPDIDWRSVFLRFLNNRGRIQSRGTYSRESRRFAGYPGRKRSVGLRVLVALDESGSISDQQLLTFLHELEEVRRSTRAQILVTEFDAACTQPMPAARYRHTRTREKRGGTDFRPVFVLADRLHIGFVLVFTDGQGTAPPHVNQRVLWVLTGEGAQPAPYGDCATFQ